MPIKKKRYNRMNPERRELLKKYDIEYKQTLSLQHTLWFGKFKGKSVLDIIETKVSYITYCLNEKIFLLDNAAFETYSIFLDEQTDRDNYGELKPDNY